MNLMRRLRLARERFRAFRKSRGLQYTLSISFSLAAIIGMLLLTTIITLRSDSYAVSALEEESQRLVSQINVNLDLVLRDAMRISESTYYRILKKNDLGTEKITSEFDLTFASNTASLVSMGLFSDTGELLMSNPYTHLKNAEKIKQQDWFEKALHTIENVHFSQPYVQQIYEKANDEYHWVITLSRSVQLTKGGGVSRGVLAVDMKYSLIEQILKNIALPGRAYLYLTDHDGNIIYHPRQQLIFSGISAENNFANAGYEEGVTTEAYEGQERLITVKTVGYTGWKIIAVTPLDQLQGSRSEVSVFSMFFVLLAIFLIILTNYVLSAHIVKPIKRLEKTVLDMEQGLTSTFTVEEGSSPEIYHLSRAIHALIVQQEQLRARILSEQESKRRSELEALQAQINPHFLYNTLDSIIWMVENERYKGAVEMVTSLARFFRLSLAKGQNIITVAKELEQVQSYLSIQKVRYRNQFEYTIDVADDVKDCLTIKLIVQPLVENAILHGMAAFDDEGEITISAYGKEAELFIDVADNGLGMTEEQVQRLLKGPVNASGTVESGGSGIGVANVNARIKLFFGARYGLQIISAPDEGTLLRIHLPKTYNDESTVGQLPSGAEGNTKDEQSDTGSPATGLPD